MVCPQKNPQRGEGGKDKETQGEEKLGGSGISESLAGEEGRG